LVFIANVSKRECGHSRHKSRGGSGVPGRAGGARRASTRAFVSYRVEPARHLATWTTARAEGEPPPGDLMKKLLLVSFVVLMTLTLAPAARAALDIGDKAPNFSAPAALAGKQLKFSLAEALAKGPVVLYFFPAAFSVGCSAEAHSFAEAVDQFAALGATVIGISSDDIETQLKFSAQACQGKFVVASDAAMTVIKSYDAAMMILPDYANRVSYVIAPDGSIVYNYQSLNPSKHVEKTLAALRNWEKTHPLK
jgi:peroxiredoxin Q/BCP